MFRKGVQGCAGVLANDDQSNLTVFKLFSDHNYLAEHEMRIMNRLHDSLVDTAHAAAFAQVKEIRQVYTKPLCKSRANILEQQQLPFEWEYRAQLIERSLLMLEYVPGDSLARHIRQYNTTPDITIVSLVIRTLNALQAAYDVCKFTHYDLHTKNVIVTPTTDENDIVTGIPTFGVRPVLIDFGFSYVDTCDEHTLCVALEHSSAGITSYRADSAADGRRLVTSVAGEMHKHRRSSTDADRFYRCIKDLYETECRKYGFAIDTGYRAESDLCCEQSPVEIMLQRIVEKSLSTKSKRSPFVEMTNHAFDLLSTAIKLPLPLQLTIDKPCWLLELTDIEQSEARDLFVKFYKQFKRLEDIIGDSAHSLYVLKCIADVARDPSRDPNTIGDTIKSFAPFFTAPRTIDWTKMTTAFQNFATVMAKMYGLMFTYDSVYKFPDHPTSGEVANVLKDEFFR